MKRLLTLPTVLAGLMICLPTNSAKADPVLNYVPYSWTNTAISWNYTESSTPAGYSSTELYSATPSPAGIIASVVLTGSSASGIGGANEHWGDLTNNTVWKWNLGGTPAGYDEVAMLQYNGTISYSGDAWGSIGNFSTINNEYDSFAVNSYHTASSSSPSTGNPIGQRVESNSRPGQMYLNAEITDIIATGLMIGSTPSIPSSVSISGLSTSQIDYIVP